jgi:hypothetical protein
MNLVVSLRVFGCKEATKGWERGGRVCPDRSKAGIARARERPTLSVLGSQAIQNFDGIRDVDDVPEGPIWRLFVLSTSSGAMVGETRM